MRLVRELNELVNLIALVADKNSNFDVFRQNTMFPTNTDISRQNTVILLGFASHSSSDWLCFLSKRAAKIAGGAQPSGYLLYLGYRVHQNMVYRAKYFTKNRWELVSCYF